MIDFYMIAQASGGLLLIYFPKKHTQADFGRRFAQLSTEGGLGGGRFFICDGSQFSLAACWRSRVIGVEVG